MAWPILMLAGIYLPVLFITCPHLVCGKLESENSTVVFCFRLVSIITAAFPSVMVCRSGCCLPQLSYLWCLWMGRPQRTPDWGSYSQYYQAGSRKSSVLINHVWLIICRFWPTCLLQNMLLCAILANCNLSSQFLCCSHLYLLIFLDLVSWEVILWWVRGLFDLLVEFLWVLCLQIH